MVEHLVDPTSITKEGRWPQHLNWAINKAFRSSPYTLERELDVLAKGCSYLYEEKTQEKLNKKYWWKPPKYWTKRDIVKLIFMAQAESWQSWHGEDGLTNSFVKDYYEKEEVPPLGDSSEVAWEVLNKYADNIQVAYLDYGPWVYCVKAIVRTIQGVFLKKEGDGISGI